MTNEEQRIVGGALLWSDARKAIFAAVNEGRDFSTRNELWKDLGNAEHDLMKFIKEYEDKNDNQQDAP